MKICLQIAILLISIPAFAYYSFDDFKATYLLKLTKKNGYVTYCSSVAITGKHILTAAHCLEDTSKVEVLNGHYLDQKSSFFQVSHFNIHPDYDKSISFYRYDIGIIRLAHELPSYESLFPVNLPKSNNDELIRIGFGQRNGLNSRVIISGLQKFSIETDRIIIEEKYSYSGDSGGPIYQCNSYRCSLIGIHSTKDGAVTYNPIFTKDVRDWILDYIKT